MQKYAPHLYLFISIIILALLPTTYEGNNLRHYFNNIKSNNFTKETPIPLQAIKNLIKRANNTLFSKRELADSTYKITITINGPKENAQIIGEAFSTLPSHIYLNDNTDDLGSSSTINLDQEGPNKIVMVWDSEVKNCISMFSGCSSIVSIDLSEFNPSLVTTMKEMFLDCSSLSSLTFGNFVTSANKNMNNMFKGCSSLQSLDLSTFTTEKVTNMAGLFLGCSALNSLDISTFNTIKVTNMEAMFSGCSSLTSLDLTNFDTSSVKTFFKLFSDCKSLSTIVTSSFNTKSVTTMNSMFINCSSLINLDLTNFDTSLVTNMNGMFRGCSLLQNINIPNINTSSVENMNDMFYGCKSLQNLDILSKFDTSLVTTMNSMFKECSSITSLDLSSFNTNLLNNVEMMFFGCAALKSLNLANFKTPALKTMDHLFNGCQSLTSLDISHFNTSLVKNMGYLFKNCLSIKSIDVSSFDTTSTTTMLGMFSGCSSLESLDLSNFRTSDVKSMNSMFMDCVKLEFINLANFNMTKPSVNDMFLNCPALKSIDLTNFIGGDWDKIFEDLNISSIKIINRTNMPDSEDNIIIINEYENTNIKEIMNNLDNLIVGKDPSSTYKISGNDYQIYIKPVNTYVEDASVNIIFDECEKILKANNPSTDFTILQLNLKNNNTNCLVDQVEYKIYDENQQSVDLSVCKDANIKIEYKLQNTSVINMEKVKDFKDKGIDVFNINDPFFNDICYPYTDGDSDSDMILSDRVSDVYQNYSICGENCKYDSFNIEKQTANCNCKIKNELDIEIDKGNFEDSIESAFLDSNFGVIKCYNLVFSSKGKLNNYGFWIFGVLILSQIPSYIILFINGINPIQNYIKNEMNNKGYSVEDNNSEKEKEINVKKLSSNKHMLSIIKEPIDNEGINNSAPPKKRKSKSKKRFSKQSKTLLKAIKEDSDANSKKNSFENDNEPGQYQIQIKKDFNQGIEKMPDRRTSMKNLNINFKFRNNLSKTDLDTIINEPQDKKKKRFKKKRVSQISNIITTNERISEKDNIDNIDNESKKENNDINFIKADRDFPLILINANNSEKTEIMKSNHKLDIYNYDEAILYEQRTYFRIFFIYLISKDNLLNLIFFNPPLILRPLRICLFIFNYACDLALNALFYLSDNISDKYHYTGANRLFFSLINNMTKALVSTIVGFILLFLFQSLSDSSNTIVKIFRTQDNLLKKDKKYKVNDETKIKISNDLKKILKCLKIKIICFSVFELLFILFFFYYVTAFCQVYKNTQVSWLLDSLSSYIISFFIALALSLIFAMLYKISVGYKINIIYKISLLVY